MDERRIFRKQEHLLHATNYHWPQQNGFDDVVLIHQALSDLDWHDLDLTGHLFNRDWPVPLYINAMTGGTPQSVDLNRALAKAARLFGIPMAVGSQMAALENPSVRESFAVVREVNREGVIWANLGSYATPELAARAVAMLDAQAIQIHLNVPQEMAMHEGDRHFSGVTERIEAIAACAGCPVIIKEVGFGLSSETVARLELMPVAAYDTGGKGGTNFVHIEEQRSGIQSAFLEWGLPTVTSLLETTATANSGRPVFASGGISNGLQVAKSIAIGAQGVGVAGVLLKAWAAHGEKGIIGTLYRIIDELKTAMMLTNCADLNQLRQAPLVIKGDLRQWLQSRGIGLHRFERRAMP